MLGIVLDNLGLKTRNVYKDDIMHHYPVIIIVCVKQKYRRVSNTVTGNTI